MAACNDEIRLIVKTLDDNIREYFRDKPIVVTGASGFVGRNLVNRLSALGLNVHGICNSRAINAATPCDMTNYDQAHSVLSSIAPEYVFMLAAKTYGISVMASAPDALVRDNIVMNANTLDVCHKLKVKKVSYLSSSTAYQESFSPLSEDDIDLNINPHSAYSGVGWVKRYSEKLCEFYGAMGMDSSIIRTTAVYGKYDKYGAGSHFLPSIMRRVVEGKDPLVVWGNGNAIRNMIYVDDLIRDMMLAFMHNSATSTFNVCSDTTHSIREMTNMVLMAGGSSASVVFDAGKPEAIPYRDLNRKKFDAFFGKQEYCPLSDGILATMAWLTSEIKEKHAKDNSIDYN